MGPSFVKRVQVDTGANIVTVARAYSVARIICRAGPLLRKIESLDYEIPAGAQVSMMFEVSRTLRHVCYWLIEQYGDELDIVNAVERLKDNMARIYSRSANYISRAARVRHEKAEQHYIMADLAAERKRDVLDAGRLYSRFNDELTLYWLHNQAEDLQVDGRWQAKARSNLRDEFYRLRRKLAFQLLTARSKQEPRKIAETWLKKHAARSKQEPRKIAETWLKKHALEVDRFKKMIAEMQLRDEIDFATLTVAAQELRDLISA